MSYGSDPINLAGGEKNKKKIKKKRFGSLHGFYNALIGIVQGSWSISVYYFVWCLNKNIKTKSFNLDCRDCRLSFFVLTKKDPGLLAIGNAVHCFVGRIA